VLNYDEAYAVTAGDSSVEVEWVVMVQPGVTDGQIQNMCQMSRNGCKLTGHPSKGGLPFFEMRGTESDLEEVLKSGPSLIKYAEPDPEVRAISDFSGDDAETLWGLERVGAYKRASAGQGVTVAVLDTGIRMTHQDFGGRAVPGVDLTSGDLVECNGDTSCAVDLHGHGSHCAGSAGGTSYGVAPGALVLAAKCLSDTGGGGSSWSWAALDWLATSYKRPVVASMSLGGPTVNMGWKDAIDAATAAGVTVVVAAGNSNLLACSMSPSFVPSAIVVGSTTSNQAKSSFSNFGECTDIWAPGSNIKSVDVESDTEGRTMSGTSMACPHVAGGAALVLEENPAFSSSEVLDVLLANAWTDTITGLSSTDTNKELYVGSDAPPPAGSVTPPAPSPDPECPSAFSYGPDNYGDCTCNPGLKCYYQGVLGACPFYYEATTSDRQFVWYCYDCICKEEGTSPTPTTPGPEPTPSTTAPSPQPSPEPTPSTTAPSPQPSPPGDCFSVCQGPADCAGWGDWCSGCSFC